jgi:hypothetical protein
MRNHLIWVGIAALGLASCGGSQSQTAGPRSAGGNEDLHIPTVNPSLCDPKDKKVVLFDLNQDGKPDMWKLLAEKEERGTKVDVLTCKEVDLNHDGKKDYVAQYDEAGNLILEEYDFDFDGHFDARIHYDKKTGKKFAVERMTGFNDEPDVWEKYGPDEKLETVRRDRNLDGKPDYWEQYQGGVLDKILYDDDYDGKVDRKEESHPERDLGIPAPASTAADASTPAAAPASAPAAPGKTAAPTAPTKPAPAAPAKKK